MTRTASTGTTESTYSSIISIGLKQLKRLGVESTGRFQIILCIEARDTQNENRRLYRRQSHHPQSLERLRTAETLSAFRQFSDESIQTKETSALISGCSSVWETMGSGDIMR